MHCIMEQQFLRAFVVMLQMITSISLRLQDHMQQLSSLCLTVYSFTANYSPKLLCDATVQLLKKSNIRESCYIRPIILVGLHGIDLNVSRNSPTHTSIIIFPFSKYFKGEGIKDLCFIVEKNSRYCYTPYG